MQRSSGTKNSAEARIDIRKELEALAEPAYRDFNASLLPGTQGILGVRLPALRKLAKKLARQDWRGYLEQCGESYEENMLRGFLIGYAGERAGASLEEILEQTTAFLPRIDNWAVCDCFCSTMKIAREYPQELWEYLTGGGQDALWKSGEEFTVRFVLVMLLNYYITGEWLDRLFPIFDQISHPGYYVKMAAAWAVSICYVAFPAETESYLSSCALDDFTYNKALQKITESRCVDGETKKRIRGMKRK